MLHQVVIVKNAHCSPVATYLSEIALPQTYFRETTSAVGGTLTGDEQLQLNIY